MAADSPKVLVSSNDFPEEGLEVLRQHCTVVVSPYSNFGSEGRERNHAELLRLAPGCRALVWTSNLPLATELLDAAGASLQVVATSSAGYNHCNLAELRARRLLLSNTPDVVAPAVADVALALLLAVTRRFRENLQQVEAGEWEIGFDKVLGVELGGSTVGIIGLGGIGQAVVRRLKGFDVHKFLYTGHKEKSQGVELGAEFVSLERLLRESDAVVVSCPLTHETRHLIDAAALRTMKRTAVLVNVSRGELVEQEALVEALTSRRIWGAGLDVTTPEPLPRDHPLLALPNCFVLPHIGTATAATRARMGVLAARNVVHALTHGAGALLTPVPL